MGAQTLAAALRLQGPSGLLVPVGNAGCPVGKRDGAGPVE